MTNTKITCGLCFHFVCHCFPEICEIFDSSYYQENSEQLLLLYSRRALARLECFQESGRKISVARCTWVARKK